MALDYEMKRGRIQVLLCRNRFKQRGSRRESAYYSTIDRQEIRADSRPLLPVVKTKSPGRFCRKGPKVL